MESQWSKLVLQTELTTWTSVVSHRSENKTHGFHLHFLQWWEWALFLSVCDCIVSSWSECSWSITPKPLPRACMWLAAAALTPYQRIWVSSTHRGSLKVGNEQPPAVVGDDETNRDDDCSCPNSLEILYRNLNIAVVDWQTCLWIRKVSFWWIW